MNNTKVFSEGIKIGVAQSFNGSWNTFYKVDDIYYVENHGMVTETIKSKIDDQLAEQAGKDAEFNRFFKGVSNPRKSFDELVELYCLS